MIKNFIEILTVKRAVGAFLLLGALLFAQTFGQSGNSAETFQYKTFYITAHSMLPNEREVLTDNLDAVESRFTALFDFSPSESFDIYVSPSVRYMTEMFGINYRIGGYYRDFTVFIQPIEVLVRKGVLFKVVCVEYAHYFIDSYTGSTCPLYVNEMLADYYFRVFNTYPPSEVEDDKVFREFKGFSHIAKHIKNHEELRRFYSSSRLFLMFCNNRFSERFPDRLLRLMHGKKSFEESFKSLTGSTIEEVYNNAFIPWLESR